MTDNCNVVFRGDIAPGFTLAVVRQGLKDFFSLDDTRLNQLFSGRPVTIKKNVEQEKAEQFQTLLAGMGALAEIVRVDGSAVAAQATTKTPEPSATAPGPGKRQQDAPQAATAAAVTIAPAGADVLTPEERSATTQREIATDHLSVDAPDADVLKPHERKQAVTVQLDLSHLKVEPADDRG